jgi:hypothetical protein
MSKNSERLREILDEMVEMEREIRKIIKKECSKATVDRWEVYGGAYLKGVLTGNVTMGDNLEEIVEELESNEDDIDDDNDEEPEEPEESEEYEESENDESYDPYDY